MATKRRFGSEASTTRDVILDATVAVLVEQGYAAVTTRRVADRAGLKAPLVHYYYRTTDDLLIAAYRRSAESSVRRHSEAMARDNPLEALWALNVDPRWATQAIEFLALANHRKGLAEEIARYAEQIRGLQAAALDRFFRLNRRAPPPLPPAALSLIVAGIARALVMEGSVGIQFGHAEARAAVEGWLLGMARDVEEPAA